MRKPGQDRCLRVADRDAQRSARALQEEILRLKCPAVDAQLLEGVFKLLKCV